MAKPAGNIAAHTAIGEPPHYEQPVSERMRTFLRLEFLYQQMLYNSELEHNWATRSTIAGLLEIMAILSRGDVRSEVHKELDHQLDVLQRYQSQPGVDSGRLDTLIRKQPLQVACAPVIETETVGCRNQPAQQICPQ